MSSRCSLELGGHEQSLGAGGAPGTRTEANDLPFVRDGQDAVRPPGRRAARNDTVDSAVRGVEELGHVSDTPRDEAAVRRLGAARRAAARALGSLERREAHELSGTPIVAKEQPSAQPERGGLFGELVALRELGCRRGRRLAAPLPVPDGVHGRHDHDGGERRSEQGVERAYVGTPAG